jgi:hypothetical protein
MLGWHRGAARPGAHSPSPGQAEPRIQRRGHLGVGPVDDQGRDVEHERRPTRTIKQRWNSGMPSSVAPKKHDRLQPSSMTLT